MSCPWGIDGLGGVSVRYVSKYQNTPESGRGFAVPSLYGFGWGLADQGVASPQHESGAIPNLH